MINTREMAEEYRLSHWAQIMRERVESGLSINGFCKQIGICGNTYFYWQRKLRETAAKQITQEIAAESQALVPNGWAVCEETRAELEPEESAVSIEIGKCHVKVDAGTDPELLAKVCRVLMSLC